MVVDTAHDPMLALLEWLDPPCHRITHPHWYIDLSRSVAILVGHSLCLTIASATPYGAGMVSHTKEVIY
jgi:hypothetical protein